MVAKVTFIDLEQQTVKAANQTFGPGQAARGPPCGVAASILAVMQLSEN